MRNSSEMVPGVVSKADVAPFAHLYTEANLSPPRFAVRVPSPFVLAVACGIAAGIWHCMRRPVLAYRWRIIEWLMRAPQKTTLVEWAVRSATSEALRLLPTDASFSAGSADHGGYPAHWTEEDRIVWDATAGTLVKLPDENGFRSSETARRLSSALESILWNPPEVLPDDRDFTVHLDGIPELLEAIFGPGSKLGRRLLRLSVRLIRLNEITLGAPSANVVHSDFLLLADPPESLSLDGRGRPHRVDGAFCRWRDGSGLYAIRGVAMPAYMFETPERLTIRHIDGETNLEIRRAMIERYGVWRYMNESGAQVIDSDARFGRLYRKELRGDEPITMVAVTNATSESDGSFRQYHLRVPRSVRTAREAVAWTFGMRAEEYQPLLET